MKGNLRDCLFLWYTPSENLIELTQIDKPPLEHWGGGGGY